MKALLYFHTIRHLRLSQITDRIRYKLHRPKPDFREPPPFRPQAGTWVAPCEREQSLLAENTARFLNETRDISSRNVWNDAGVEKLWLYNLHYFDDLNAAGAATRRDWHLRLIGRWMEENPAGQGNGWEPYTTSLRIVNWIKWALNGAALPPQATASLAVQTRYLCERLEFHLLGNHLLANAKALVFAGAFFNGPEAEGWLRRGLAILHREIPEQILADGGHFELSPMYHSVILEDCLDMENLALAYGLDEIVGHPTIDRMRDWLATMCHPDGEIAFFNDAAIGIAPSPPTLEQYAARLGHAPTSPPVELRHLTDSGYVRARCGAAILLADVARVGPDYLPGHAHADTLSFEFSLHGRRVMVNSGTSRYGSGLGRQQERSTLAHNTLAVDGQDSSEMWGGFRVARRASVHDVRVTQAGQDMRICATHDGYRRLVGRNRHHRCWHLEEGMLEIGDEITGRFGRAEVRFHLHPEVKVQQSSPDSVRLELPQNDGILRLAVEGGRIEVLQDIWHPGFGLSVGTCCLAASLEGSRLKTRIVWGGEH